MYFVLRNNNERRQKYESYAWLGFWANFIFLLANLISIPIYQVIYPKEIPSTYISNVHNASIISTHPSAEEDRTINKERLQEQLPSLKQTKIYSYEWYMDTHMSTDSYNKNERFPYQLVDATSKWGSGVHSIIFIEDDGKGILITTADRQLYFRSENSIIEGMD
nr:hypothetical protein [Lysinibacillus timonensis]